MRIPRVSYPFRVRSNNNHRKSTSIRPKKIMKGARIAYSEDLGLYQRIQHKFTDRKCPGCSGSNSVAFCIKDGFRYRRCQVCLSIYMSPGPTQELVDNFYASSENYKYWSRIVYPQTRKQRFESLHKTRSLWLSNVLKKYSARTLSSLRLLEFGAGDGGTLTRLQADLPTMKLWALEPNPDSRKLLKLSGLDLVDFADLETDTFDDFFSTICSFEVIEHLLLPDRFFAIAAKVLKSDGLIFCSTPNSVSLEVGFLKDKSSTVDIEHISLLSPLAIKFLCDAHGFELLELETPGEFDLELLQDSKTFVLPNRLLRRGSRVTQDAIKSAYVSSHMRFVARKIS